MTTFSDLFHKATHGLSPFPYQTLLAEADRLPRVIAAPTGAGKTAAAILGWLWRRRFHPSPEVLAATPRRLVYCLPMRVLVEQTVTAAREWLASLDLLADEPGDAKGVSVWQLMGGEVELDWDQWPEADAVLVGTQDQLLSRALNRGYAMSRYRWPVHFGLLNSDCLWVMDEVQLMGAGLATTAQLQALREQFETCGPAQSVWMSATLRHDALATTDAPPAEDYAERTLELGAADLTDPQLSRRLSARKPVQKLDLTLTQKTRDDYARELAKRVLEAHRPGSLTLVVVNQVRRAQDARRELQVLAPSDDTELLLVHGRFRPAERRRIEARLSADVPAGGRIVVATQAIEAGVDLSARTLLTELAPWSSLVQRFGRCNRRGEWSGRDGAAIYWVDIATGRGQPDAHAAPYQVEHLDLARELLTGLSDAGIKVLQKIDDPTPPEAGQVLRRRDLVELFDTTPDLAGEDIDVSPFIREADRLDVAVAWRDLQQEEARDKAPLPEELCPVGLPRFREFAERLRRRRVSPLWWDGLEGRWQPLDLDSLRPGMTLLLDVTAGGYDPDLGWWPEATTAPVAELEVQAEAPEGYDDDPLTPAGRFVSLAVHLADVTEELDGLLDLVGDGEEAEALREAARLHDIGKAHPWFQDLLMTGLAEDAPRRGDGPWAKSDRHVRLPEEEGAQRPHFRHELASALAMLEHGGGDLAAYLAASHHGKVRLSIRSLPGEKPPEDGGRFARGIWEGDTLPAVVLGDGTEVPETRLCLQVMELGLSAAGPSWLERTLALRDKHGPFRLAFLEALLRIADWRASAKEREEDA